MLNTPATVGDCLLAIAAAGERLADATIREMQLEDQRALVKDEAIGRLRVAGERSVTAAEKVIEKDPLYMEHRQAQYRAIRERIRARAEYDGAVLAARLTIELGEALNAAPAPIEPSGDLRRAG